MGMPSSNNQSASSRSRRRGLIWVIVGVLVACGIAAAVLVLTLTGTGGAAPSASPTPAQTPSASASTTPPPSASPTSSPAPPAADPAEPSTWIVSQEGIGPFRLGDSFAESSALVPEGQLLCTGVTGGFDDALWLAERNDVPGTLDIVSWKGEVGAPGPLTEAGIGVGSSADELWAAYPDARDDDGFVRVGTMFFHITDGQVTVVGVTPGEVPWELCS